LNREPRKILEIISEETRYEIIKLIISKGRYLTVAEIAEELSKDKKTVDKHLKILLEYKLIERKYLEDEKAYGYYVTSFTSYLINSINKAFETNVISSEMSKKDTKDTVKIVQRKIRLPSIHILGIIFIVLGFIIAYGSLINLIPQGNEVAKLLIFLFLVVIGIYLIYRGRTHGK
jgi:DNA-binding transcriptional ArsR family regulator